MIAIQYHSLGGRSLAYSWSHGPVESPIVVLHGLGDSAIHTFAPRFAATSLRNSPALFIDLPGFGEGIASASGLATIESLADDVLSLLTRLAIRQPVLFGHSMGANIAIALLHHHPKLAHRLIVAEPLLNPTTSVLAAGIAKQSKSTFLNQGLAVLIRATQIQAHRGDLAAAAFLPTLQMAEAQTMYAAAQSLIAPRHPDFAQMLGELTCPKDLLIGERTRIDNDVHFNHDIRIHTINNAGHAMMVEQSEATAYAMLCSV